MIQAEDGSWVNDSFYSQPPRLPPVSSGDDGKLLPPDIRQNVAGLAHRLAELERVPAPRDMSGAPADPVGTVKFGVYVNAPPGYLLCDGSSTEGYPALIAVLGAAGLTTTVTPDLRGRVILGASGTYGLGSTGGAATKSLSTAEMPAHTHGGDGGQSFITDGGTVADITRAGGGEFQTKATTASTGSGTAFSLLPPYIALTPIIRAV